MDTQKVSIKDIPRFLIGYAARFVGCHPNTLKTYEDQGYVKPIRDSSGFRRYTKAQIEKLKKIYEIKNPS